MELVLASLGKKLLPTAIHDRLAASSIAKRLARGSLWSLFGSATARILVLVAMILVARVLGQVAFGELGLIQSTLGMIGLMAGMGLGGTATRFVAQHARSDPARAGRVIALFMSVSAGTVLLTAATAFQGIPNGVLAGLEKLETLAKLNILEGAVSLAAMLVLAHLMGINGAVLGLALAATTVWLFGRIVLINEMAIHGPGYLPGLLHELEDSIFLQPAESDG